MAALPEANPSAATSATTAAVSTVGQSTLTSVTSRVLAAATVESRSPLLHVPPSHDASSSLGRAAQAVDTGPPARALVGAGQHLRTGLVDRHALRAGQIDQHHGGRRVGSRRCRAADHERVVHVALAGGDREVQRLRGRRPGFSATGLVGDETVQPGAGNSANRSKEPATLPTLVSVTSNVPAVFSPRYCSAGLTCTKGKGTAGSVHESLSLSVTAPLSLRGGDDREGIVRPDRRQRRHGRQDVQAEADLLARLQWHDQTGRARRAAQDRPAGRQPGYANIIGAIHRRGVGQINREGTASKLHPPIVDCQVVDARHFVTPGHGECRINGHVQLHAVHRADGRHVNRRDGQIGRAGWLSEHHDLVLARGRVNRRLCADLAARVNANVPAG